jgi:hypothetical protein
MLEAQQDQSADEYDNFVAAIEQKHSESVSQELSDLNQEKESELVAAKQALDAEVQAEQLKLKEQQEQVVDQVKQDAQEALAEQQSELEQQKMDALAQQEAELEAQKQAALAQTEAELKEQQRQELERVAQAQDTELAEQQAAFEQQKNIELAQAAQENQETAAEREAALEAQNAAEMKQAQTAEELKQAQEEHAEAEAAHDRELAMAKLASQAEKQQALENAAQAEQDALEQLQASLDASKSQALEDLERSYADELEKQREAVVQAKRDLNPFVKAAEAKEQIVNLLNENFKEFDESAVEIDEKTGKVKLNFQESYFIRGSHELSEDMKDFLRIMIPKYAKSIYENEKASELVESLKISGMTSPIYMGKYIDIHDTSPRSERARQYNMQLSNKRALAMYNFIFDEAEMGNYRYRADLKKDMGIAALGFQNAQPVRQDLVGEMADCIEYNCQKEQATVLQFQLYTEESAATVTYRN